MYKLLRRIRIVVSTVFAVMLALVSVDTATGATGLGRWMLHTQLVPAILAGSGLCIVVWVILTLWFGRIYCSTVCPLGTYQDAAACLGRKLSSKAGRRYRYHSLSWAMRVPIPAAVAATQCLSITSIVKCTDPFNIYSRIAVAIAKPMAVGLSSVILAAVVALVIGAVAWKRGRLLCNTVCPAGGLLALLGRSSIYRIDINTDKCIHCGKCEDVCKAECIDLKNCTVDISRCIMCQNCTAICPNEAIILRRGRYRLSTPMLMTNGPTANNTNSANNT